MKDVLWVAWECNSVYKNFVMFETFVFRLLNQNQAE